MTNNHNLEAIFNYVHKLEKRITELEQKEAVTITGYLESKFPKPIDISEEKLIDIYNDVPQILAEYAVEASLTAETYRQKTDGKVILEHTVRGNYWVILLEQQPEKKYYLVPNGNIKIRLYRLQTIEYLFTLKGEKIVNSTEFNLLNPALIYILPNGNQWQLQQKGLLNIGKDSPAKKLVSELEKIAEDESKIPSRLPELLTLLEKINQDKIELKAEIKSLRNRLIKLEPEYSQLVNLYHDEPQYFAIAAGGSQKVRVTDETMNSFLQGKPSPIYLESNESGEYIIKKARKFEYLFPHPDSLFDKMALNFIHNQARLFICLGEIPIAIMGKDLKIQKPAKVKQTENRNLWLLIESGEILL